VTQHQRILRENALLTQLGGSRAMVRQLAHEIKNRSVACAAPRSCSSVS